jgi:hypothetical protein
MFNILTKEKPTSFRWKYDFVKPLMSECILRDPMQLSDNPSHHLIAGPRCSLDG